MVAILFMMKMPIPMLHPAAAEQTRDQDHDRAADQREQGRQALVVDRGPVEVGGGRDHRGAAVSGDRCRCAARAII